jgi:hypothetical protein
MADTPPLDPASFAEPPARDARFQVVDRWADCMNFPDGHPEKEKEFFHRQMNEECNVLENAARNISDFPDADWGLRFWLARQCSDEARHVLNYRRIMEQRGGQVGDYPIMNFQYRILGKIDTMIGRLAVQNRTFEADGLDAVTFGVEVARDSGDDALATMYETQQADEVLHIRFANEWIRRQVAEQPRSVLSMARALTQGARAFAQVFSGGGTNVTKYGVAEEERLEAGFAPEEVHMAAQMTERRRGDLRGAPA